MTTESNQSAMDSEPCWICKHNVAATADCAKREFVDGYCRFPESPCFEPVVPGPNEVKGS